MSIVFFFNDTATTEIYTLSLHDALPISSHRKPPGAPQNGPLTSQLKVDPVVPVQENVPLRLPLNARPGESMRAKEMVPSAWETLNSSPPIFVGIASGGGGRYSTDWFGDA